MSVLVWKILEAVTGQIVMANIRGEKVPPEPGKSIFQSKTTLGVIVMVLAYLSQRFGWGMAESQLADIATQLMAVGGAVLALYGRVKANQKVGAG